MGKRHVSGEVFDTPAQVVETCLLTLTKAVDPGSFDVVVEPSAGSGAFLAAIRHHCLIAIDIEPRHPQVARADFLTWQPPDAQGRVLVIGNPPFGQRGALAMRFVQHAATFAHTIAFILPRSFRKDTFQSRVPECFHLVASCDLGTVTFDGPEPASVPTVFQVWQRQPTPRVSARRPSNHPDFQLVHAHLSRTPPEVLTSLRADFAFTIPQVGSNFRPRDVQSVERGSHWFVKPHVAGVRDRFERADYSFLEGMNTAHTSLAKADIVEAYLRVLSR